MGQILKDSALTIKNLKIVLKTVGMIVDVMEASFISGFCLLKTQKQT